MARIWVPGSGGKSLRYALAIAQHLGGLCDPFDFESVWDAFAKTDLAGIHYEFDGEANLDVAVTVADSLDLSQLAALQLGAKISVGIVLGGKFFLTFRAGPRGANGEPRILAALSRQRSKSGDLQAKLSAVQVDNAFSLRLQQIYMQMVHRIFTHICLESHREKACLHLHHHEIRIRLLPQRV